MEAHSTYDDAGLPVRAQPDGSDIRPATGADRAQVVDALARGFHDDPLLRWVSPDAAARARKLDGGFDLLARRVYFPAGGVYTTDRLVGAACWLPPGGTKLSVWRQLTLLPGLLRAFRGDFGRLNALLRAWDEKHPHGTPHWYLAVVAVQPEWQGRGFGAALLQPVLDRCDRERLPAYLEASSPRNRTLYERLGFEVREEVRVKDDSPPSWPMWREPQA